MSEFNDHMFAIGRILKDEWYWIAGAASAFWYAGVRAKRAVFHNYVTSAQMAACKDEIVEKIEAMREENNAGIKENAQQHQDILKTVVDSISDLRRNI